MSEDHERIEELLAGYVLEALSGEDAEAAEALLAEHVPTCLVCRRLLHDYRAVAGDLALAAAAEPAPDAVLASLRRDLSESDGLARGRRLPAWAGAAAAVAFLALGGLSVFLLGRVSDAEDRTTAALDAFEVVLDPAARVVPMQTMAGTAGGGNATVAWKPGEERCVLVVEGIARPRRQREYEVWFTIDGRPVQLAATFLHRDRVTILHLGVDVRRFDGVWIAEGTPGDEPPLRPVLTADV